MLITQDIGMSGYTMSTRTRTTRRYEMYWPKDQTGRAEAAEDEAARSTRYFCTDTPTIALHFSANIALPRRALLRYKTPLSACIYCMFALGARGRLLLLLPSGRLPGASSCLGRIPSRLLFGRWRLHSYIYPVFYHFC